MKDDTWPEVVSLKPSAILLMREPKGVIVVI